LHSQIYKIKKAVAGYEATTGINAKKIKTN
jgi:hypothetical protein